ncbi:MAG: ketosteroid isomerase family protein [Gammaproteobacteria bacterium]|jgi:hypothetical protein|nr:ketosteroid isomerase family protein [Gammaproteobacteria bacterium]
MMVPQQHFAKVGLPLAISAVIAAMFGMLLSAPGRAQTTAAEARQLLQTYVEAHNSHALDEVMQLYSDDAVFYLNSGRGPVRGRQQIRELELFDTVAGSTIYPQGLTFAEQADGWAVAISGALEHSEIFAAFGVAIVLAEPIREAFFLANGQIIEVHQPELAPACREVVLAGFVGLTDWLRRADPERAAVLTRAGRIHLTPATIPDVIAAIGDWRSATGWAPARSAVSACAGFTLDAP